MRIRNLWIAAAVIVIALASVLAGRARRPSAPASVLTEISRLKQRFTSENVPALTLDLEALLIERAATPDLVNPQLALPRWVDYDYEPARLIAKYRRDCRPETLRLIRVENADLRKALEWQRFRCHDLVALPPRFFESAPLIHPSGSSYAALAREAGVRADSAKLHLLEAVNDLLAAQDLPPLTAWQLQNLIRDESMVLGRGAVLFRKGRREAGGRRAFSVFRDSQWIAFIAGTPYSTTDGPRAGTPCVQEEGTVCWTEDTVQRQEWLRRIIAGLALALTATLVALVFNWLRRLENEKREAAQRLFILQILTHELRTPVASLKLSVETMRPEFDLLPRESQKSFLRICDELQRLDRVANASRDYLKSNDLRHVLQAAPGAPVILRDFLERLSESYPGMPLEIAAVADECVSADPYWLELCVRNLIDNAFAHGKPPVRVTVTRAEGEIRLSVRDEGDAPAGSRPSAGMGIGLHLIEKTVAAMGGRLSRSTGPTVFTLHLQEVTCPVS